MSTISFRLTFCAFLITTTLALVVPVTRQEVAPLVSSAPIRKLPNELMMSSVEPEASTEPSSEPSPESSEGPIGTEEPEMTDSQFPSPEPDFMDNDNDEPGVASIIPSSASGSHMMDTCYLQSVEFGTGTAERCCEERFTCNSFSGLCGRFACRKVYIKFSYTQETEPSCENQLVNHSF